MTAVLKDVNTREVLVIPSRSLRKPLNKHKILLTVSAEINLLEAVSPRQYMC